MPNEPKPAAVQSYHLGDVGDGARVAESEYMPCVKRGANLPDGRLLAQQ